MGDPTAAFFLLTYRLTNGQFLDTMHAETEERMMRKRDQRDFMDTTPGLIGAWLLYLAVAAFIGVRDGLRWIGRARTPKGVRHG